MYSDPPFERFLERLREGDDQAAVVVTQRFGHRLAGLASKRLSVLMQPKIDAQDALQSAYRSFFVRCRDDRYALDGWNSVWLLLARITVRKCRKHHRYFQSQQRQLTRERALSAESNQLGDCLSADTLSPDLQVSLMEQFQKLLSGLGSRDRRIIGLFMDGHDVTAISRQVGCTERTSQRVLRRIRTDMEAFDVEH